MAESSFASENFSTAVDENVLSFHSEKVESSKPWGEVTDPKLHHQDKYRYLVHAINPMATSTMMLVSITEELNDPSFINKEEGDQTVNLYSQPERLAERVALSCSLIDYDHTKTWGAAGLIIQAPENNVVITQIKDTGSMVMSKKNLLRQASELTKLTADQLLKSTSPQTYNEVVVLANENNQKVALVGFFYKTTDTGSPLNESLYKKMLMHSQRLQLPLIPISEPNIYTKNKITHNKHEYSVQYNGKRYCLIYSGKADFKSYDQMGIGPFTSPEELELVFGFLQRSKKSQTEIDNLRNQYREADRIRQLPQITYDKQEKIESLEKHTGYGAGETKITIYKTGWSSKVNVLEELKKYTEKIADSFPMRSGSFGQNLLSPFEAESTITEAIGNASDDKKEIIKQWWQSIKPNLSKQWEQSRNKKIESFWK